MIYNVIFENAGVEAREALAKCIKEAKGTFVFILTPTQQSLFDSWCKAHQLNDLIIPDAFVLPSGEGYITNFRYPNMERRLKLIVMKGAGNVEY